ncbi:hypothetical protein [Streptomyces sp. NPDC002467]|uniref:hypothetical protein n=1 Tax=Streptomyces sp. NPDC002467 TaxID=3364647 RepID=UPI00369FF70E
MTSPFRHPLATHPAGAILGYRTDGRPIHAIAGGSDEGAGAAAGTPPAGDPGTPPPATPPAAPAPSGDETDWKAEARKWEKWAKENKSAREELDALKAASQTEQEKAVTAAEKAGRTAAASEYAGKLAAAEFRAACASAGVDLGEAAGLIDTGRFAKDGEVDTDAIKAAVKQLAKLAPRGPGRSGGDLGGGGSGDTPASLDKQIEEAQKAGRIHDVIALKRRRAAQT